MVVATRRLAAEEVVVALPRVVVERRVGGALEARVVDLDAVDARHAAPPDEVRQQARQCAEQTGQQKRAGGGTHRDTRDLAAISRGFYFFTRKVSEELTDAEFDQFKTLVS